MGNGTAEINGTDEKISRSGEPYDSEKQKQHDHLDDTSSHT